MSTVPVVLVVDDEPTLLALMSRVLREQGYAVLAARDGAAALVQMEHLDRPVELLVTDIRMPGITGEALAQLALSRGLARRLLFVSGFGAHPSFAARLAPVLAKPFTPSAFRDAVEGLLDRR